MNECFSGDPTDSSCTQVNSFHLLFSLLHLLFAGQYTFRALQLTTHWSSAARFVAAIVVVPLSGQNNEDYKSTSKQSAGARIQHVPDSLADLTYLRAQTANTEQQNKECSQFSTKS